MSFSLREAKRIPNWIAERDSDKEEEDDGHVEETFVAEENRERKRERAKRRGITPTESRMIFTVTHCS